jgi:hypothetical protein
MPGGPVASDLLDELQRCIHSAGNWEIDFLYRWNGCVGKAKGVCP